MDSNRKFWGTSLSRFAGKSTQIVALIIPRVTADEGQLRALLFHYTCGPITLGRQNKPLSTECCGAGRDFLGTPLVSRR